MRPEHWLYTIPLRLRSLFRWAQADRELDDELRDHLERKTEEYVAQGMTQEEAHRRARLDLGGIEQTKEKCRDTRRVRVGAAEVRRSCVPAFSQHVLAQLHFYPARSLSVLDGAREWGAGAFGRDDVRPLRQGRTRTGVAQGMGRKSGLGLQASARVQASPEPKVGSTSAPKLSFWTEWTENRNFGPARNGCKPMIGWWLLDYSPVAQR